jgi:hypothetical protein
VVNFIILIVGFCLISIFAGYVFGYGTGDDFSIMVGWVLAISYGGLLLAILIRKEFIQRPRSVELIDPGVMLMSRLGSQRFVPWDNIRYLAIDFTTPEKWHGQIYHDAKIKLFNGSEILVIHEIAMAVKKRYETVTGRSISQIKWY